MPRLRAARRQDYTYFLKIPTRWHDMDAYGHVNNGTYFEYFDTVIQEFQTSHEILNFTDRNACVFFSIESHCNYLSQIRFPDQVTAGLRVGHLGNSSVRFDVAFFRNEEDAASAQGHSIQVFVDRHTDSPSPIPEDKRAILARFLIQASEPNQ